MRLPLVEFVHPSFHNILCAVQGGAQVTLVIGGWVGLQDQVGAALEVQAETHRFPFPVAQLDPSPVRPEVARQVPVRRTRPHDDDAERGKRDDEEENEDG